MTDDAMCKSHKIDLAEKVVFQLLDYIADGSQD